MVKVCKCCSNMDVEVLKSQIEGIEVELGCVDNCTDASGKAFGLINEELVVVEDVNAFAKEVLARK